MPSERNGPVARVEGRLGEIRNTDYGMREFGFVDSDGTLHRVGFRSCLGDPTGSDPPMRPIVPKSACGAARRCPPLTDAVEKGLVILIE